MADYHVNHLTGNDTTGDGSASLPWATIAKAYTVALSADTIKVAGSDTTVLDTSATFTGRGTNQINTSTDLTSQLSVNDFIILSPNYTDDIDGDFDGWITLEISAITSTTITLFGSSFRFPNQDTHSFTISKHNSVITSTSGWETLTANGETPTIIGGWDNTFTSVIGLTVVQRIGLSTGGASNDCINVNSSGTPGSGIKWKNFKAMKFNNFFYSTNFTEIPIVDNIHGATVNGWNRFYGFKGANGEAPFKVYATNCGGAPTRSSAFNYAIPGLGDNIDFKVFQHVRVCNIDENCVVENFTGATSSISANSAEFGAARIFTSTNIIWKGKMSILVSDVYTGENLYRTQVFGGGGLVNPSSVNIVSDNEPYLYNLYEPEISNGAYNTFQFIMPSGFTFVNTAAKLSNIRDVTARAMVINPDAYLVDDSGEWNMYQGSGMSKIDTTDYDTGNSSRVLKFFKPGYAGSYGVVPLISFTQRPSGTPPTGVTFRIKYSGPSINVVGTCAASIVCVNEPGQGSFWISDTAGGWVDYTWPWPENTGSQVGRRLMESPDNTIQIVGLRGLDEYEFKVDSVTVNYA